MSAEPRMAPVRASVNERFSLVYEELRRLAATLLRNEPHAAIRPTALVDEAWVKVRDSPRMAETTMASFKGIAAHAMRQVLVEEARRRQAEKRGGNVIFLTLDDQGRAAPAVDVELLDLDEALSELAVMSERQARMVEQVFFGGLTVEETAVAEEASKATVERELRAAKAWIAARMRPKAQ